MSRRMGWVVAAGLFIGCASNARLPEIANETSLMVRELPKEGRLPDDMAPVIAARLEQQPELQTPLRSPIDLQQRLRRMQARMGLPVTGTVDARTAEALGVTRRAATGN
jgi:hypothetical protein